MKNMSHLQRSYIYWRRMIFGQDLLGSTVSLPYLFTDNQMKVWGNQANGVGKLSFLLSEWQDRPSNLLSNQHWWRDRRKDQHVHQLIHYGVKWGQFQIGCSFWKFSSSDQGPDFWQSFVGGLSHGLVETMCGANTLTWSNCYDVVYSTVLLAHGLSITLLPAIVGYIQSGLGCWQEASVRWRLLWMQRATRSWTKMTSPNLTPNLRVELPYTYLMAWYIMHCPSLITSLSAPEGFVPFVQRLENSNWIQYYMFFIRRTILSGSNYQFARCFPDIPDASYEDKFLDFADPDGFTTLSSGIFLWLINIRLRSLVFRQGNACTIEAYMPSRFARKFGFDQLYIENPNASLCFSENLFEGVRTWYYNSVGRIGAVFSLPHKTPNSYISLSFYMWYIIANTMLDFRINTFCIKAIKSVYNAQRGPIASQVRGMNEYLEAEKEGGKYEAAQESERGVETIRNIFLENPAKS